MSTVSLVNALTMSFTDVQATTADRFTGLSTVLSMIRGPEFAPRAVRKPDQGRDHRPRLCHLHHRERKADTVVHGGDPVRSRSRWEPSTAARPEDLDRDSARQTSATAGDERRKRGRRP